MKSVFGIALALSLGWAILVHAQTAPTLDDYPNAHLLVDTAWLAEHLDDPNLRVLDARAAAAYRDGHIPGAFNLPLDAVASTVDRVSLEFDADEVQESLNAAGLTSETTVVIYDDLGMMTSARLFWTLEYVGHQDARILDGGWNAWQDDQLPISTDIPDVTPTEYPISLVPNRLITADELLAHLDDPAYIILDARSLAEYTGEVTFSRRSGHIPGARLFSWFDALTGGDFVPATESDWQAQLQDDDVEVFRPADEIQALLLERNVTPDKTIVTYCQTFWRGAHLYYLLRLMGYDDVRGYDGSWSEWGNRDDLPIVTGDQPGSVHGSRG